jgi:DNA ligase D-like protein (predicted ligase)
VAKSPRFVDPMTATNVEKLPEGDQWIYEVKLDGYRALVMKEGDRIKIVSRKRNDLTATYPAVVAAARKLKAQTATLDGEIVALDGEGRPSFQALQHRASKAHAIVYYAFDLLHLNGEDLTALPLAARQERLRVTLKGSAVLISEPLAGTAQQVTNAVAALGLEGVIAKRRDSTYNAGVRSGAWLKLKLDKQQEFVVGGYRPGDHGVDALLVGVYEGKSLHFAAKVRAGFTPHLRREVFNVIRPFETPRCPFADLPNTAKKSRWGEGITPADMLTFRWVKPKVVVQIRFVEWTEDAHLRHAAFLGVRTDKRPADVQRET